MSWTQRRANVPRAAVLRALGALAIAEPLACVTGSRSARANGSGAMSSERCIVTPAQTEGPFFIDDQLERSDLRSDEAGLVAPGVPLRLHFSVHRTSPDGCVPLPDAHVDVWHADASGSYSGEGGRQPGHARALRGFQRSDRAGDASFVTIFPGWYAGRAVHVHFKIRTAAGAVKAYEFTSQLYFDDGVTDAIYRRPPYAARGPRPVRNAADGIFSGAGAHDARRADGRSLVLALHPEGDGYAAHFAVALDLAQPFEPQGPPPGGPPPGGPPPGGPPPGGPPPAGQKASGGTWGAATAAVGSRPANEWTAATALRA